MDLAATFSRPPLTVTAELLDRAKASPAVSVPPLTAVVPVTVERKVVRPELWVNVPIMVLAELTVPPLTRAVVMLLPLLTAVPPATVRLAMVLVLLKFTVAAPLTMAAPKAAAGPTVVLPPLALNVATLPPPTLEYAAADCRRADACQGVAQADAAAGDRQRGRGQRTDIALPSSPTRRRRRR